jgi:HAD superfamily hydrolase (TIGR01509 family)
MTIALPPGDFEAYLFDCDGTIADSMPLHYEAWQIALAEHGGQFPKDLFYAWAGVSLAKIVEKLNLEYGLSMPADKILLRKEQLYYESLPKLRVIPGVLAHIQAQYGKIPFAVVSGSQRESIAKTLHVLGLTDYFPVIVGAEDTALGKPHPDPFLLAAKLLNVSPERCLVFEDADLGIESARAAGMSWVRVPAPELP